MMNDDELKTLQPRIVASLIPYVAIMIGIYLTLNDDGLIPYVE